MQADIFFDMSFKVVGGLGLFLRGADGALEVSTA
jgi:hypothetical protein